MPINEQQDREITFISGVDANGKVAATSYYTMEFQADGSVMVPAQYGNESSAIKWGNPTPGQAGGTVKYWFADASGWTNTERIVWEGSFAFWSGIADIDFELAASAADANVTVIRGSDKQAHASFGTTSGKVAIDSATVMQAPASGSEISVDTSVSSYGPITLDSSAEHGYVWSTLIHEIGHIVGLGHGGPYNANFNTQQQQFGAYDSLTWSVMSYMNAQDPSTRYYGDYATYVQWIDLGSDTLDTHYNPLSPQMLDILAVQRLYGASSNATFNGGKTYGFNSSFTDEYFKQVYDFNDGRNPSAIVTIWSHGTGNTLDLSGFTQNAMVDLTPGTFSSAGGRTNNIAIAFDTVVETAKGGGGNDTIRASNVASTLEGNDGNDVLMGGSAGDTLTGGDGDDLAMGGDGTDTLDGGVGSDVLLGGDANDTLTGDSEHDVLNGGAAIDTLSGGSQNDWFQFQAGQANGDTITDFSGQGGDGDFLQFFGYGTAAQGATFTQLTPTTWQITSADNSIQETITVANGAAITADDYDFLPGYTQLENAAFMDFSSWRSNAAGPPTGGVPITGPVVLNVALVLDRAEDPTALLSSNWATRQRELATLNENGTLWSKYGADAGTYAQVLTELQALNIKTVDQLTNETGIANGYVSSAASRTVWVQVTQDSFSTLFGPQAKLMAETAAGGGNWYWTGNLSLPTSLSSLGVSGLWFDTNKFNPVVADPGVGLAAELPQGWQSLGNASTEAHRAFPQTLGSSYYNLPLGGSVPTGTIGLVEPGVGTALDGDDQGNGFQAALDAYRAAAGVPTGATAITVANGGQAYPNVTVPDNNAGERSLDAGIVATVAPNSPLVLYAGSGSNHGANANNFTAYQSAIWDLTNNPQVISSSYSFTSQVAPGSPFFKATNELWTDVALRNISLFSDMGDRGSGNSFGNGLTNASTSRASPYVVMVGGTSLSTVGAANADATLADVTQQAMAGDLGTLWRLAAGGLTQMPGAAGSGTAFVETIWNRYYLDDNAFGVPGATRQTGYLWNNTGGGGTDPGRPTPQYQKDYGLVPVTNDPYHLPGRGSPDVSANAGGNMSWLVPGVSMTGVQGDGGTSASTPFWAGLTAQINGVFANQRLPQLGYMNDLLYIASAIAPAVFNDISMGKDASSFVLGGPISSDSVDITPTGYGYEAAAGYDLASGLGTPNALLLARELTHIAHHQMSFADIPSLIDGSTAAGWTSGADQTFLIQATTVAPMSSSLKLGDHTIDFSDTVAGSYAWTSRFAEQVMQDSFDPNLVRLFDKQAQGWVGSWDVAAGSSVSALIGQGMGFANQAALTSPFGMADFSTRTFTAKDDDGVTSTLTGGNIHLARAVAVAETVDRADGQTALVRVRQNGEDQLAVTFYKVDDYAGKIGNLNPGDAGYAAASAARAYGLQSGDSLLLGPGYGLFEKTAITNVNGGDLIAMTLTNRSSGDVWYAFANANSDGKGHIVNYGHNTWGFEDTRGGGDHDFNDLVVQIDFTSNYGNGWLV
jgi:Ca2+-binding RTX toxin-like protein